MRLNCPVVTSLHRVGPRVCGTDDAEQQQGEKWQRLGVCPVLFITGVRKGQRSDFSHNCENSVVLSFPWRYIHS